jgi:polysaccharide biosynthesis transport protein
MPALEWERPMNELTPRPLPDYQMGPPLDVEASPAPKFRLHKFLAHLRKYWWVPVGTLVLSLAAAAVYVRLQPPIYVSTGSMWEPVKLRLPEGTVFSEDMADFLGTQTELLQSSTLRELALARLRDSSNHLAAPLDANGDPPPVKIRVSQTSKSSIFTLEATGSDAGYTRTYLEALMEAYQAYKADKLKEVSGVTLASITQEVTSAEQERNEKQNALTEYQRTNNLAVLQVQGTTAGGYLAKLKTELSDLQLEERLLTVAAENSETSDTAAPPTSPGALETGTGAAPPESGLGGVVPLEEQNAFKDLEMLKMQKAELSSNLLETHPRMVKLNADIERAQEVLNIYLRENRSQLTASLANTRLRIENVRASIKQWEANVVEANARIAEAEGLKIDLQRAQGDYERLAALLENVTISRNIDQESLDILEAATPAMVSYNHEKSSLVMAGTGGLALGLLFIAFLAIRDEKFSSVMEVNEKLGDAVIAQVPEVSGLNGKLQLQMEDVGQMHMYAESYRCLRSALLFSAGEGGPARILLITSALPDEGKSTVAMNLARTLAMGSARVLLVDADLRRGELHKHFGLQQEPGLAQLLSQPGDADKILQTNSVPNLWIIPCGTRLKNPGDLFLGAGLDQLLKLWRSQFDYVLIDSSPIFAADDATTLAPKVDGALLVVRSQFSSARQVREALDMLYQRQARVLGVVFNRANASARSYDYYKYSKYYPEADTKAAKTG